MLGKVWLEIGAQWGLAGSAIFTTEPSMKAILDPRIVAASVRRLRRSDSAAGYAGVAPITPASHGGGVKPTIGASKKRALAKPLSCGSWVRLAMGRFSCARKLPFSATIP